MYLGTLGVPLPFARFPGWLGPSIYVPWMLYALLSNPAAVLFGYKSSAIAFSQGELLYALAGATALAVVGVALMAANMNASHRKSFCGRLSLKEYVAELWDERTYAPLGQGIDASRAHILKFSKYGTQPQRRL